MATSSTIFHVSTQTTVYLSTVLVDQTNYTAWMFRIEAFLKGQKLYGFVDGSTVLVAKGSFPTGSYNGNHTHSRDGIPATCFPSSVSLPSHSQRMPVPGVLVHLSQLPTELMGDHNSVAVVSTSSDESVGTGGNGNDCNNVGSHNGDGYDDYDSGSNSAGSENASNHGCTSDFVDGSHVVTCEEDNIHVFNATIQGAYVDSNYSHDSNVGDQVDDSNADNNGGQNSEEYGGGASGLNSEDNDVTHHDNVTHHVIDGLSSDIDGENGDSTSADMSNDIVKLYCSFQDDEYLYVIMELNLLVAMLQEKRNTAIYANTYALWIIGQYCLSLYEVKCGIATIKQCLVELPFYTASVSSRRPVVLADGTYVTQSTALTTTMSAPVRVQGYLASVENLRSLILSGDLFLESVVACTLTKLVLRLEELQPSKVEVNKATTQALLIMVSMFQLGQSFVLPYPIDNDSHDKIVLCIMMKLKCIISLAHDILTDVYEELRALACVNDDVAIMLLGMKLIAYHVKVEKADIIYTYTGAADGYAGYLPYVNSLVHIDPP